MAAVKADQVFLPVLENASKAHKLRSTLGVFDRSKFFFNLPGAIIEAVDAVSLLSASLGLKLLNRCRGDMKSRCVITRRVNSCWRIDPANFYL